MGESRLRYAPMGPFVTNPEGGGATPGQGFQTRAVFAVAENLSPIATAQNTVSLISASLADVKTNVRYRAAIEVHAGLTTNWTTTGTVAWTFEYSADAGANWTTFFTQEITYGLTDGANNLPADAYIQTVPFLGSALTGVSPGDTLAVRVRAVLGGGGSDNAMVFTGSPDAVLQLLEQL